MKKVIWIFWAQGWDSAPPVARASRSSWETLNPDWEVRALDGDSPEYSKVKEFCQNKNLGWAAKSDLLRLDLLKENGGVWVDATTICLQPLDEWLENQMGKERFFLFKKDKSVSSWFLASDPSTTLISEWHERSFRFLENRKRPDVYLWLHRIFNNILKEGFGAELNFLSASTKKKEGPHFLCPTRVTSKRPPGKYFYARLLKENPPLLKLAKHPFVKGSQFELFIKPHLK